MLFKDLKVGYPLYVLNRNSMSFEQKKVQNVTLPHADSKMGGVMNMVVDVTVDDNRTFVMVADSETAYPDNMVIATELAHIKREAEAVRSTAENALSQVEHQRELVEKCNRLLCDIDPTQKEKQQTEQRFSKIETNLDKLMEMMKKLTD